MPEKPEVQLFADALHKHLLNKVLFDIHIDEKSRYNTKRPANYYEFITALPSNVTKVWSKGKKVIICLENGTALVSSLGEEGKWLPEPRNHSGLMLKCGDGTVAYFDDTRHHGMMEIVMTPEALDERLSRIGLDLLNDNVSAAQWIEKMRLPVLQNKEICYALMTQKYVSGIGNYIKAMTLYRARVCPAALLRDLSDEHLTELHKHATDIIRQSYRDNGASLKSYSDFYGNLGKFKVEVYSLEKDPKAPCGNPVVKNKFADGRTTHWCIEHQVLPAPWKGPQEIDMDKLRASKGRGKDTYKVTELQEFCRREKIGCEGKKEEVVDRLLKKLG